MKSYLAFILFLFLYSFGFSQVQQAIAVDPNTYTPNHSLNKAVPLVVDKTTGRLLINTSGGSGSGGDASAVNQTAVQANSGSDASKAVAIQGITGGKSIPITVNSLPLPAGGSTSENQATTNNALGTPSDISAPTGNGSISSILKAIRDYLASTIQVRGSRSNAGTDLASGASHLTVGGSNGTTLKVLRTDDNGNLKVQKKDDITFSGTINAVGNTVSVDLQGADCVLWQHTATTFSCNLTHEISIDGGINWGTVRAERASTGAIATTTGVITATGESFKIPVAGATHYRARATAVATAGAIVTGRAVYNVDRPYLTATPDGTFTVTATNLSSNTAQIAGQTIASVLEQGQATTPRVTSVILTSPTTNNLTEVASAARTASGNSGTITSAIGCGLSAFVNITAASGTTPTLDLSLEESFDNGTTYVPVWHFERVTAISSVYMPPMPTGARRRWAWTIAGTTPSFTFSITTTSTNAAFPLAKQFFDRTAGLLSGTLNATSSTYQVSGINNLSATVTIGAATTPGTYQIQVSNDAVNWVGASTATPAVASSTVLISKTTGVVGRFARIICTSAATAQTGTVTSFYGIN